MSMLKACRCGKIIPLADKLCDTCKARYGESSRGEKIINTEKHSFYTSPQWKAVQAEVKARDYGLCVDCYSKGKLKPMHVVHHIEPIGDKPELRLTKSKLICLCERCHQRSEKKYKGPSKQQEQERLSVLVSQGIAKTT